MGKEGEKKNNDHNKKNCYDDRIKRKETTLDASIAEFHAFLIQCFGRSV